MTRLRWIVLLLLSFSASLPAQKLDQLEIIPGLPATQQSASTGAESTISLDRLAHPLSPKLQRELNAARKDLDAGRLESAVAHMSKVVASDPANTSALNDLGVLCLRAGDVQRAAAQFHRVLELQPDSVRAHIHLAAANLAAERAGDAEPFARRAVELAPARSDARLLLGMSLLGSGRYTAEAATCLETAAADYPEARLWLAEVLYRRGDASHALRSVQAYLDSGVVNHRDIAERWLQILSRP